MGNCRSRSDRQEDERCTGAGLSLAATKPGISSSLARGTVWPSTATSPSARCARAGVAASLPADTLRHAFVFLRLQDIAAASRTCRAWKQASLRAHKGGMGVHLRISDQGLSKLLSSPLRCHVTSASSAKPISLVMLTDVARLPGLRSFQLRPDSQVLAGLNRGQGQQITACSVKNALAALPLTALQLHMPLFYNNDSEPAVQMFIDALPGLHALQNLQLSLPRSLLETVDFTPLLSLPHLTRLTCAADFGPRRLAVLRQLPALRELHVDQVEWSPEQVGALCALPLPGLGELNYLPLECSTLQDSMLAEVARAFPQLTALEPRKMERVDLAELGRLTQLRRLRIATPEAVTPAQLERLAAALRNCPDLTRLDLGASSLGAAGLSLLAGALPQLRDLRCSNMSLHSFAFLRQMDQLECLSLKECTRLPGAELDVAGDTLGPDALPRLRRLEVTNCDFADPADEEALRVPSERLPSLRYFTCVRL